MFEKLEDRRYLTGVSFEVHRLDLPSGDWDTYRAGDLDGDQDVDFVNVRWADGVVSSLLNDGEGEFAAPVLSDVGFQAKDFLGNVGLLEDVDGDSLLDLLLLNRRMRRVEVMRNLGAGSFATAQSLHGGFDWHRYDVGDIDVDGDLDIVVLKSIPLGTGIDWHENINGQLIDAAPLWRPPVTGLGEAANRLAAAMQPTAVSATLHTPSLFGLTDIDSDGDLDIRLTGDSSIVVLENQGGQFVFCEFCDKENHSWVSQVDDDPTVDVDGDGVAEFFTAGVTAVGCGALLGEECTVSLGIDPPGDFTGITGHDIQLVDLDGDGDVDMIPNGGWLENTDGQGGFGDFQPFPEVARRPLSAVDFDGDGDVDVLGQCDGGPCWLESHDPADVTTRINVGGQATVDPFGKQWQADAHYSGGFTYSVPPDTAIASTEHDTLFQSERAGNFQYAIPSDDGEYVVRLHFAEIYHQQPNQRAFDVAVEGELALDDFDIVAELGERFSATQRTFRTVVVADGVLNLGFTAVTDSAKLSGIELIPVRVAKPTVGFAMDDVVSWREGDGAVSIEIQREGDLSQQSEVELTLERTHSTLIDWWARFPDANEDDLDMSFPRKVVFSPGEARKTVSIPVVDDRVVEAVESYWIGLRPVENATIYGRARTLLQVRDDESYGVARVNLNDSNSVDADGRLWRSFINTNPPAPNDHPVVVGAENELLYRKSRPARRGLLMRYPLQDGLYDVELHFSVPTDYRDWTWRDPGLGEAIALVEGQYVSIDHGAPPEGTETGRGVWYANKVTVPEGPDLKLRKTPFSLRNTHNPTAIAS